MSPLTNNTNRFATTIHNGKVKPFRRATVVQNDGVGVVLFFLYPNKDLLKFVKAIIEDNLSEREEYLIKGVKYVMFNPPDDFGEYEYYLREIKEKFEIFQIYCIQRCCTERDFVDQYTTVRDLVIEAIKKESPEKIVEDVKAWMSKSE